MILAVCIDDRNGMLFNGRRQSQDRVLREDLVREAGGGPLWMNAYSARQFDPPPEGLRTAEDFLEQAGPARREEAVVETAGTAQRLAAAKKNRRK